MNANNYKNNALDSVNADVNVTTSTSTETTDHSHVAESTRDDGRPELVIALWLVDEPCHAQHKFQELAGGPEVTSAVFRGLNEIARLCQNAQYLSGGVEMGNQGSGPVERNADENKLDDQLKATRALLAGLQRKVWDGLNQREQALMQRLRRIVGDLERASHRSQLARWNWQGI